MNRSDNFNRANAAGNMGSPSDGGAAWTNNTSNMGIIDNQAYDPGAGFSSEGLQTSVSDGTVIATMSGIDLSVGVVARRDGDNDYLLYRTTAGAAADLYKRVAGTFTWLATGSGTVSIGDTLAIICNGTSITCQKNGSDDITGITESAGLTNTYFGISMYGDATGRIDNFSFTELGAGGLVIPVLMIQYRQRRN